MKRNNTTTTARAGNLLAFIATVFAAMDAQGHGEDHEHASPARPIPSNAVAAGYAAQAAHRFDEAITLLEVADTRGQLDDPGRLLLASVYLVKGEAGRARKTCSQLDASTVLIVLTCRARTALSLGDFAAERRQLDAMLSLVTPVDAQDAWLAWSFAVAGDLAAADNDRNAGEILYRRSLALHDSAQVRAALADLLIAEARWRDVIALTGPEHASLALDVRRLIAARRLGNADSVVHEIERLDAQFERWMAAGNWLHAREMARFYFDVADRPALAARIAGINLDLQREREDLRLAARSPSPDEKRHP